MHALISSDRFRASWSRLDASEHSDRMAAFEGVRRLLAKEGHDLQTLLEMAVSGALAEERMAPKPSANIPASNFGDIFKGVFSETFRPQAPVASASQRPKSKQIIYGRDVPSQIIGQVKIREIRPIRTGRMAVVGIENGDSIYDPLVSFDEAIIEILESAALNETTVRAVVAPPQNDRQMPKIRSLSIVLNA